MSLDFSLCSLEWPLTLVATVSVWQVFLLCLVCPFIYLNSSAPVTVGCLNYTHSLGKREKVTHANYREQTGKLQLNSFQVVYWEGKRVFSFLLFCTKCVWQWGDKSEICQVRPWVCVEAVYFMKLTCIQLERRRERDCTQTVLIVHRREYGWQWSCQFCTLILHHITDHCNICMTEFECCSLFIMCLMVIINEKHTVQE